MSEELDRIVQPARPVDAQNKDPLTEEVIVAWQASMSQREIARTLGISRYRVRKIAEQFGLQFNTEQAAAATQVHAERAHRERAEMEERLSALAHTELDKAEESEDSHSRFMHIRNCAILIDKSIAIAENNAKLGHGADDAEEGKRLVGIQLAMMQDQASRVREIMLDPTPGKKQPDANDPFGHLRVATDDEPP